MRHRRNPRPREPLLGHGLLIELDVGLCEEVVLGLITCVGEGLVSRPHLLGASAQGILLLNLGEVALDLGFHVVIGVGRLNVQQERFYTSTAFHHAHAIPSVKFFSSECCSPIVSCHRPLSLKNKFLHSSHRENGSFEVLSLHSPSVTEDRRQL